MPDSIPLFTFALCIFLLAGVVKGVIGLGLPTIAMGLLGLIMAPPQAAALLILPSLVTNIWQAVAGRALVVLLRRLWPMLTGVCFGTWAGTELMTGNDRLAASGLGLALIGYALWGLKTRPLTVPLCFETGIGLLAGAITGLVTAATGVFVLPAVPYLQALRLAKDDLVQALGLSFTVSTLALAISLARDGHFSLEVAGSSIFMLLPALAGMAAGQWIRRRVRPATFRICFFVGLLLLGSYILLRSL